MSVVALVVRPTGPAATDASPPSSNLSESRLFMPFSFMKSKTKSVDEPPACKPTLPPLISKTAGADQPDDVRQLATPRPPDPPMMKPALTTLGNTATHSAFASRSRGIPLSGVAMISVRTLADLAAWLAPSLVFGPRHCGSGSVGATAGLGFDLRCALTGKAPAAVTASNSKPHSNHPVQLPLRLSIIVLIGNPFLGKTYPRRFSLCLA